MTTGQRTAILSASLLALALAAPGFAQTADFSFAVDRQDIQTDAEARESYAALRASAESYCAQFVTAEQCVSTMLDAVVTQIDSPAFTAVHAEETQADAVPTLTASYTQD